MLILVLASKKFGISDVSYGEKKRKRKKRALEIGLEINVNFINHGLLYVSEISR